MNNWAMPRPANGVPEPAPLSIFCLLGLTKKLGMFGQCPVLATVYHTLQRLLMQYLSDDLDKKIGILWQATF